MKTPSAEWVAKAKGDYASAMRELRARSLPNYDSACFHAQQCIEKLLKAVLIEKQAAFQRTHDLEILLEIILPIYPHLGLLRPDCQLLTQYAVHFRYPGEFASKADATDAVKSMIRLSTEITSLLKP
jgi:HEPN domain-containing protein